MKIVKYKKNSLIILFGGARREKIIFKLFKNGFDIKKIFVPKIQSDDLKKSINNLKKLNLKIQIIKKNKIKSALIPFSNSLLFSIGFPYILPKQIFSIHPLALNIHPTLLPKYKGPTTGAFVLKNNEKLSGSTIHLISKAVDSGDILAQTKIKLSPFDTIRSMQRKVYAIEPNLASYVFEKLKKGIITKKQTKKNSTIYKKKRKPKDSKIDIRKPLIELINDIRACDLKKFPAYFHYKNHKVYIKLWRSKNNKNQFDEF